MDNVKNKNTKEMGALIEISVQDMYERIIIFIYN